MTESMAYAANMCIKSDASLDTGGTRMKYLTNTLKETIPIEQNDSIRGTRSRNIADIAQGNVAVAGQIGTEPTPIEIDRWLPFMGFSNSGNVWTLTESIADMYVRTDMTAKVFDFLTRINVWTFSMEPGKKVKLAHDLVGKTLTIQNAGSTVSGTVDDLSRPYRMADLGGGFVYNGTTYDIDKLELKCDNKIDPTYMSGQTATDLEPTDRIVTLTVKPKYIAANVALLADARAFTPRAASFTLTNGNCSLLASFAAVQADSESVEIASRNEKLRLPLKFYCYQSSTTKEVVLTNDSSA